MTPPSQPPGSAAPPRTPRADRIAAILLAVVVIAVLVALVVWAATPGPWPSNLTGLAPGHPAVMTVNGVTLTTLNATVSPCVIAWNGDATGDIVFHFDYRLTSAANQTVGVDVFVMLNGNVSGEHFYWISPGGVISDSTAFDAGVYNSNNPSSTTCPSPPAAWLNLYGPLYNPSAVTWSRVPTL